MQCEVCGAGGIPLYCCGLCTKGVYCGGACQDWDLEHGEHGMCYEHAGRHYDTVAGKLGARKAAEILSHGSVRGHRLTAKQRRYMGWVAGGKRKRK